MPESLISWMEDRQAELNECLLKLANIPPEDSTDGEIREDLETVGNQMLEIYSDDYAGIDFRHQYHLLSEVIQTLDGEQLDSIPRNLNRFIEHYSPNAWGDDRIIMLVKLYDHLSIEIERNRDHGSLKRLSADISAEKDNLAQMGTNIAKLNESLNNHQIQLVSILGIFSAIIFVFVGGFDFLSGAIASAKDTEIHQLLCIVLVVGFFFLNMIALLLWVIGKVARIDLIVLKREFTNTLYITDALILVMLAMVFIAWNYF